MKRIFSAVSLSAVAVLAMACFSLTASIVYAQESMGAIAGIVTDSSGAVISGAAVTITNINTGEKKKLVSSSAGGYLAVSLVPGTYMIDVESPGFKRFRLSPIDVQVATASHLDIALDVGAASEVVTVTSETALVETESSSIGQVIEGRTVQETPLNGRNIMNMLALDPGVIPQGSTAGSTQGNQNGGGHTNRTGYGNYQIGGGLAGMSAQFLDGAPMNVLSGNIVAFVPTQDFVQEFKVETNNVSAQFGRFSGGVVTMTSKPGENQIHGTVYEYVRNDLFDANDWFSNLNSKAKPYLRQNQYGVAGGGPIKHDKIFYFGSYDRYVFHSGYAYTTTVPTMKQRTGDFSESLTSTVLGTNLCDGSTIYKGQIFDPWSTRTVPDPSTGKSVNCRKAFAGNIIPSTATNPVTGRSYIDPTAAYILSDSGGNYFPHPTSSSLVNNYFSQTPIGGVQWQANGRGDWAVNDRDHIFARYSYWKMDDLTQNVLGNQTGNPPGSALAHQAVVGHTWTINPTSILQSRISYTRVYSGSIPISLHSSAVGAGSFGTAWKQMGCLAPVSSGCTNAIPNVVIGDGQTAAGTDDLLMRQQNGYGFDYYNNYVISTNLTKILSKHTVDAGLDLRIMSENGLAGNPYTMTIQSGWSNYNGALANTGVKEADFLLGTIYSGSAISAVGTRNYERYQAYYAADTYRINPKLSVNVGLRWELPGAFYEGKDRAVVLLPDAIDPLGSTLAAPTPLRGQLAYVNTPAYTPRTMMTHHWALLAPRFGLNYKLPMGMVLHGGYGISYLPSDPSANASARIAQVNSTTTGMNTTVNGGKTPCNVLSNPFPATACSNTDYTQSITPAPGRPATAAAQATALASFEGQSLDASVPFSGFPYTQQWNFALQKQIGNSASVDVSYIGSKGTALPLNLNASRNSYGGTNLNELPLSIVQTQGSALSNLVTNPFAGKLSPLGSLNSATVPAGQLLRPYPQFSNVYNLTPYNASLSYNALMVKSEKRFGGGGSILISYVWSKMMTNTESTNGSLESQTVGTWQDFNNAHAERSVSDFNVPHRMVTSYVLDLPVGKGYRLLGSAPAALNQVVGGWSVNGIVTLQSGFPLSFTANQGGSKLPGFGYGVIRPVRDWTCDPNNGLAGSASDKVKAGKWLNSTCFTQPGAYALGNESRVNARASGAGVANWDFAAAKKFQILEKLNFEFRAEFFNLFNRVQFSPPATTVGSIGVVSTQANQPRLIQFGGRINF